MPYHPVESAHDSTKRFNGLRILVPVTGGANGGTRTPDRLITNQTHYQTVLRWP